MRITLTDYNDHDFQYLNDLIDDEYFELFGEIVLEYRKHNKLETLEDVALVYIGEVAVACGGYRRFDKDSVEIKRVFVRPEFRRRSIAQKLMDKLESAAKQNGYTKAVLQTGTVMDAAISLYRSIGYDMIPNYGEFDGDELVVCMQKSL